MGPRRLRTIRSVFTHPPMKRISNAAPPFPAEISLRAVAGAGA
jgi:hypothetical protein